MKLEAQDSRERRERQSGESECDSELGSLTGRSIYKLISYLTQAFDIALSKYSFRLAHTRYRKARSTVRAKSEIMSCNSYSIWAMKTDVTVCFPAE